MSFKQEIYNACVNGRLRLAAKPVHAGLISFALQVENLIDSFTHAEKNQDFINQNLTAVIKTFERPETLKRLLQSIRTFYPKLQVIVVDDSREAVELDGVETIIMPYDSGVSAGRSEALKFVKTKYLMLLDDDFIFNRHTNVQPVLDQLECLPEIDIIGGDVIYLPFYRKIDYTQEGLHPNDAESIMEQGTEIGGLIALDKVANFYIARTHSIRKVDWNPELKRLDHADFFTRAKGVLTTTFDKQFKVLHARTPFDQDYMRKRLDIEEDRRILFKKYYLKNSV